MAKAEVKDNKDAKTEAPKAAEGAPSSPAPRRAPGQKEVIPFEWKVCGYSVEGHTLTLFKSIEKEDSEAQLARLISEGYYEGLKLYGVDDKVPESPKAKKLRLASKKKTKKSGGGDGKKADEPKSALRKGGKTPSVITTPMGKLVDGRITVGRKKSAVGLDLGKVGSKKAAKKVAKANAGAAKKKKAKPAAKKKATAKAKKKAPAKKKAKTKTKTASKTAGKKVAKKKATKTAKKAPARKRKK